MVEPSSSAQSDLIESESLAAFGRVLERVRDPIDAAVRARASEIPAFARLLEQLDPSEMDAQSARSRELERGALVGGAWEPYLDDLRRQGAGYAAMGIEFRDWFSLLSPYRSVIVDAVLEDPDPDGTRAVLDGLGRFLDIAMSTIAGAYLETKEKMIRHKETLLQRHVRELERSNQELDEFAYVASHDLKAPLRDVQTLAGWVVDDSEEALSEESRRHLGLLGDRIARMERLLDDLLQYSRAGRIASSVEEVDVRASVDAAAQTVIPPEGFELRVTGDAPSMRTARAPFEQVLRNLLSNAVKHHDAERGHVEVQIADGAEEIEVAVADDGPGIPEEFQDRVFRMFQTLRPRDEVEGSGMGLAVVKKLVEARGGEIAVESTPGAGTTMRFTWPKEARS